MPSIAERGLTGWPVALTQKRMPDCLSQAICMLFSLRPVSWATSASLRKMVMLAYCRKARVFRNGHGKAQPKLTKLPCRRSIVAG
jgi:hypothetical protein